MFLDKFRQLLVEQNIVPELKIEQAQRRKNVFGGSLDTNLLDLGLIDEETLNRVLAEAAGTTPAPTGDPSSQITDGDAMAAKLTRVQAEQTGCMPIHQDDGAGGKIKLLSTVEGDPDKAMGFMGLGPGDKGKIQILVVPEVRFLQAIATIHGKAVSPRLSKLADKISGKSGGGVPGAKGTATPGRTPTTPRPVAPVRPLGGGLGTGALSGAKGGGGTGFGLKGGLTGASGSPVRPPGLGAMPKPAFTPPPAVPGRTPAPPIRPPVGRPGIGAKPAAPAPGAPTKPSPLFGGTPTPTPSRAPLGSKPTLTGGKSDPATGTAPSGLRAPSPFGVRDEKASLPSTPRTGGLGSGGLGLGLGLGSRPPVAPVTPPAPAEPTQAPPAVGERGTGLGLGLGLGSRLAQKKAAEPTPEPAPPAEIKTKPEPETSIEAPVVEESKTQPEPAIKEPVKAKVEDQVKAEAKSEAASAEAEKVEDVEVKPEPEIKEPAKAEVETVEVKEKKEVKAEPIAPVVADVEEIAEAPVPVEPVAEEPAVEEPKAEQEIKAAAPVEREVETKVQKQAPAKVEKKARDKKASKVKDEPQAKVKAKEEPALPKQEAKDKARGKAKTKEKIETKDPARGDGDTPQAKKGKGRRRGRKAAGPAKVEERRAVTPEKAVRAETAPAPAVVEETTPASGEAIDTEEALRLVDVLEGVDERRAREAADTLASAGDTGLGALLERFPGRTRIDRVDGRFPSASLASRLMAVLTGFGEEAVPGLLELIETGDKNVRLHGVLALADIKSADTLATMVELAFDSATLVQDAAVQSLDTLHGLAAKDPETARKALRIINEGDLSKADLLIQAIRVGGALRCVEGIDNLINLVASSNRDVAAAALEALYAITFVNRGKRTWRWKFWWRRNKKTSRVDWLARAAIKRTGATRVRALDDLGQATGKKINVSPNADKGQVKRALQNILP